ncbi:MAG: hypothetical protein HYU75_00675 [Betaproteobacteria bacterium]|nr:hypothetical protein [Betaproteobacteria bacterium]
MVWSGASRKGKFRRAALFVFLIIALVFSQAAAQLDGLSHVAHDLAKLEHGGKNIPPPHPAEQDIPFQSIGSALPTLALALEPPRVDAQAPFPSSLPHPQPPRIAFDSRAPPPLS